MDLGRFLDVLRAFENEQVEYVLVGGVAVNLHGIVRATEDIDVFVRPERENVEKLKAATGNVLVVGHSNSVPDIVKALGGTAAITIADDEFDNLFIVRPGPPASVIRLHMPPVR